MPRPRLRALTLTPALLASACQLVENTTKVEAPAFELSAAAALATHTIALCMDGPELGNVHTEASILVEAHVTTTPPPPQTWAKVTTSAGERKLLLEGSRPHRVPIELDATGPWEDQEGSRCSEPRTVTFELLEPSETTTVEVAWTVVFTVREKGFLDGKAIMRTHVMPKIDPPPS